MFRIFKALFTLAKETRRIREILEIAFAKELEINKHYKDSAKYPKLTKVSDIIIDTPISPDLDIYGEPLDLEELAELEEFEKEEILKQRQKQKRRDEKESTSI